MENIINYFLNLFVLILYTLSWAIVVRALSSWFPNARRIIFIQILYSITDPLIKPIRKYLPNFGGLDVSPLIAVIILQLLIRVLS